MVVLKFILMSTSVYIYHYDFKDNIQVVKTKVSRPALTSEGHDSRVYRIQNTNITIYLLITMI